ncbi:MAG TPA: helix-turn-helix domain-containing protein [Xanthobacteraceae bacterium]|jgi:CRP/FNR family nitrogen fixation transcriptional regulator|nr:helix-turn-helix domain-containing protein [Xanthobacteraceae bacterium]
MHTHSVIARSTIHAEAVRHPAASARPLQHRGDDANGPLDHEIMLMGAIVSYQRNSEIFGECEPVEYLYKVVSGGVRTSKILSDGRRQIGDFYLPGDIFGLEFAATHVLSAEAITDTKVLVIKRSALNALAARDASVAAQLFALTGRELRRAQERIVLLVKSAQERVAGFLLEMSDRLALDDAIELPMSRQDIADYLGLTIETVSRTLTSLESAAAIELTTARRIRLRNRNALSCMNG